MDSDSKSGTGDYNKYFNRHIVLIVFGIIFMFLAIVGYIALCGAQTGSSETSGLGSFVAASGGSEDGTLSPTTEVVTEFLLLLFTILGVLMLTYVFTIKHAASNLVNKNQYQAALIVNGNKEVNKDILKKAEDQDLQELVKELQLPGDVITQGMQAIKTGANAYYLKAKAASKNAFKKKAKTSKTDDSANVSDSDDASDAQQDSTDKKK